MNIKTSERNLYITNVLSRSDECENFICTDLNDNNQEKYLLIKLSAQKHYDLIKTIMQLKSNPNFKDCFSQNGYFYAMFYYQSQSLISSKINEYSLNEKLEVMKNLIEEILLLNVPNEILNFLLDDKNIAVDNALTVKFNYCFGNIESFSFIDIQKRLSAIVYEIFNIEIEADLSLLLNQFYNNLSYGMYMDILSVYKNYVEVYDKILDEIYEKKVIEDKRIVTLRKTIYETMKILKTVSCYVLIILAFIFLFILFFKNDDKGNTYYKQIGNLKIKEYSETQ